MKTCFLIAEAGVNHNGSEDLALQLIETAASAGADAVKFQSFKASSLVAKGTPTAEYQKQQTGNSDQYAMLKKLEISENLHHKLINHCRDYGIEFMSTPFDTATAEFLLDLGMERLKIPSGELTNLPFIREISAFNKLMILSTGMASLKEVKEAVVVIREEREEQGFPEPLEKVLTILHCTSNYPTRNEDVNLRAMQTMEKELGLPVGYSDHTEGTLVSAMAVAMGAKVIEKHFTMDRSLPGPDHQASLEPGELVTMIQQIRQIEACLGSGEKMPRDSELPVRDLVRRSVILARDKPADVEIQSEDLVLLRPGTGIPPKELEQVIGKRLKASLKSGTVLTWKDIV